MTVKSVTIENQITTNLPPFVLQLGQSGCGGPKPVEYFRFSEAQKDLVRSAGGFKSTRDL